MRPLALVRRLRIRASASDGERGYILVVCLLVLFVMLVAIGAMATATISLSHNSERQSVTAGGSAAADAGAQVALFRLNTTATTAAATSVIGNGASYTYVVAPLTSSSAACAGLWAQNSAQTVTQDCITSTGTVAGVSERIQMRAVAYAATAALFPLNGIFAVNSFSASINISGSFDLGSNGPITITKHLGITGAIDYLPGDFTGSSNCSGSCVPTAITTPYTVPSVPDTVYAAAAATNNDAGLGSIVNASTHVLTDNNNHESLTIPGGTYYLCSASFAGNNDNITTTGTPTNPVKIYIDSPSRPGSTCLASNGGNGTFTGGGNSFTMGDAGGTASNLQLYFYGTSGCTASCPNSFSFNSASITADVFAAYTAYTADNNLNFTGAMVIGSMTANNNVTINFQGPTAGGGSTGTPAVFYPSAHTSCIPSTTPGGTAGPC